MHVFKRPWIGASLFLAVFVMPASAIELALPSDFFSFTVDVPGDPPGGYYYLNPFVENANAGPRIGYELVLDSMGEVKLFRNQGPMTNFEAMEHSQQYSYGYPTSSYPHRLYLLDSDWEVIDQIQSLHPTEPDLILDGHEFMYMADGTRWTEWWDVRHVDMSQYIVGGLPDVVVHGHAIQQWDADGTILFDWRSWDHLDEIPFTARPDCTKLYTTSFEHLHVNSIDVTDDYIYVSARFTSVVYKISRATGEVIWGCGYGPGNDFTFTGPPVNIPLDFNYQHDARILENGNLTVFDNGNDHTPPHAFAREYALDEDSMTAELVWWLRNDPPSNAALTGSHRKLANGNHVVGWGNINPAVAAVEVDSVRHVLWRLRFDIINGYNRYPGTYRVNKASFFTPSYRPYVSYSDINGVYEIQCNWFGHENEVSGYNVYGGFSEQDLELWGTTTTGYYMIDNPDPVYSYYIQIVAVDEFGTEISDVSNLLVTLGIGQIISIVPVGSTIFPASGGTLTYNVTITNPVADLMTNVRFRTLAVLPDQSMIGPLMNVRFNLTPYQQLNVENLTQEIPGFAPPGDYLFVGQVEKFGQQFTDSFPFTKLAATSVNTGAAWQQGKGWPDLTGMDEYPIAPINNSLLLSVAPNPFNEMTTVSISLPEPSELQVVVVDIIGRQVAALASGMFSAGEHRVQWNASDCASGVYFLNAQVPGRWSAVEKLVFLK